MAPSLSSKKTKQLDTYPKEIIKNILQTVIIKTKNGDDKKRYDVRMQKINIQNREKEKNLEKRLNIIGGQIRE